MGWIFIIYVNNLDKCVCCILGVNNMTKGWTALPMEKSEDKIIMLAQLLAKRNCGALAKMACILPW